MRLVEAIKTEPQLIVQVQEVRGGRAVAQGFSARPA